MFQKVLLVSLGLCILIFSCLPHFSHSSEVIPYNYPLYKQCNSSWGNDLMVTQTICAVGCLMSSVSMALNGKHIQIEGKDSNPGTLNAWLRTHQGYTSENGLYEEVVPNINPSRIQWVGSIIPGSKLPPSSVKTYLDSTIITIANVMKGGHFVLVVGYDPSDLNSVDPKFYVNDPGFNKAYYNYTEIVGWRIFKMQ